MGRDDYLESHRKFIDRQEGDECCWLWRGSLNNSGYGPHKVIWEEKNGPVPEGYELDHLCKIRHCVNPDHLIAVPLAANRPPRERCFRGHPMNNVYIYRGKRWCRTCRTEYMRRWKHDRERH